LKHENLGIDVNREATSGLNHEGERTDAVIRGGLPGNNKEAEYWPWSDAGRLSTLKPQRANWQQEEPAVLTEGGGSQRMARAG
jgi:hypothetical protein